MECAISGECGNIDRAIPGNRDCGVGREGAAAAGPAEDGGILHAEKVEAVPGVARGDVDDAVGSGGEGGLTANDAAGEGPAEKLAERVHAADPESVPEVAGGEIDLAGGVGGDGGVGGENAAERDPVAGGLPGRETADGVAAEGVADRGDHGAPGLLRESRASGDRAAEVAPAEPLAGAAVERISSEAVLGVADNEFGIAARTLIQGRGAGGGETRGNGRDGAGEGVESHGAITGTDGHAGHAALVWSSGLLDLVSSAVDAQRGRARGGFEVLEDPVAELRAGGGSGPLVNKADPWRGWFDHRGAPGGGRILILNGLSQHRRTATGSSGGTGGGDEGELARSLSREAGCAQDREEQEREGWGSSHATPSIGRE